MALDIEGIDYVIKATDKFTSVARSVDSGMARLEKSYGRLLTLFSTGLGVGVFTSMIKGTIDAMDHVNKLTQSLGMSAEAFSALAYAAKLANVDTDALAKGMKKLSVNMADMQMNLGDARYAFQAMKINVEASKGVLKSSEEVLLEIADKFARMEDGAGKTALAIKLFGRAGAEMIPLLNLGSKGLRENADEARRLGIIFSTEATKSAEEFNDNLTRLGAALDAVKIKLAGGVIGALARWIETNVEAIKIAGSLNEALGLFVFNLDAMTTEKPAEEIRRLTVELEKFQNASAAGKFIQSPSGVIFGGREEDLKKQIEFLKYLQRQQALASTAGMDTSDQVSRMMARAQAAKEKAPAMPDDAALKKAQAEAAQAEATYRGLLKTLKEKLLVDRDLTEVAKLQLQFDAMSAKQLAGISPARKKELEDTARKVDLNKQLAAAMENDAKNEEALRKMREESAAAAAQYNGRIGEAILAADKNIQQIEFENSLIGLSNVAREQAIALRELETSGIGKQSEAYDQLGTRLKEAIRIREVRQETQREWDAMFASVEGTGKQVWTILTAGGENMAESVGKAIKASIVDLLYQLTLRKWIINIGANVTGQPGIGGVGGGLGIGDLFSAGSNFIGGGAGIFGSAGAYAAAVPGLTSAAAGSQAALLAAQTGAFGAEGLAMTAAAGGSTVGGGISAAMAAIPGWGWAALGAGAIGAYLLSDEGDAQRTGNWVGALGQTTQSTQNRWFGNDMIESGKQFSATLQQTEQQMAKLLGLTNTQIAIIDTKLAELSSREYGFGMEHTDWTQSGAPQAIVADRLRVIAESLGLSVEGLSSKMADAQKQIDLAPQKLQLEIDLMKLQGKETEALAAERKRELAALDATLKPLQEQIYATQDLAQAANDAAGAMNALMDNLGSALDAQISASQSAAQTARQAADAYRGLAATLADTIRQLRGGDLSTLNPLAKLNESGAYFDALFGQAQSGNADALAKLPQAATEFLAASRAYNASSTAYARDFDRVMGLLAQAGVASNTAAMRQDYQATLLETQTAVLVTIKDILAQPNPDTAILAEQKTLLATIGVLLSDQTGVILTGNSVQDVIRDITALDSRFSEAMLRSLITGTVTQSDSLANILAGTDKTVSLLQQLLDATVYQAAQDAALEEKAAADRALQQAASQATAAYESQKAVFDALLAQKAAAAAQYLPGYTQTVSTDVTQNQPGYITYDASLAAGSAAYGSEVGKLFSAYGGFTAAVQQLYDLWKAIPGHAAGGIASGWSMVGERGPELVNFSSPGRVYTAEQTRAALAANDSSQWRAEQAQMAREALIAARESANRQVVELRAGFGTLKEEFATLRTELRRLTA